MKKSTLNLAVIENFILHLTHSGDHGLDANFEVPQTYTPKEMYEMAKMYIEEDYVDGKENPEDEIVEFSAESSFITEDQEKEYPETVVVVANFGDEIGTQTVATFKDGSNLIEVTELLKFMKNPSNHI